MKYEGDIGLYLSGQQVLIPECGIFITQPTVKQIALFGETKFLTAVQILTDPDTLFQEIKQGNSELKDVSNFQILLEILKADTSLKEYFDILFELCCPDYNIIFEKNSIEFYLREEDSGSCKGRIFTRNFEPFCRTIKELFVFVSDNEDSPDYNPANAAAKAIADKIKKGRAKAGQQKGEDKLSLYGTYASILSIGLRLDLNVLYNYTPFQLYDSFSRYWAKEENDRYITMATIPFSDPSKLEEPKNWTRSFYN